MCSRLAQALVQAVLVPLPLRNPRAQTGSMSVFADWGELRSTGTDEDNAEVVNVAAWLNLDLRVSDGPPEEADL